MDTPTAPIVYAALGDSTGVGVGARGGGYPARLVARAARAGWQVRLVNACVSGARVADVAAEQVGAAVAARPRIATLGIGINDVTHGTDADQFRRDYDGVVEALASTGAALVLLDVPDLSLSPVVGEEWKRLVRERIAAVNDAIAGSARRHGCALVDLFAASAAELGRPEVLSEDRFHPSDEGYERITDLLQPCFEAALRASAPSPGAALSTDAPLR